MVRPILILATLLWFFGSSWYYVCKIKQVCPGSTEKAATLPPEVPPAIVEKTIQPISFAYQDHDAKTGENFTAFRDSIVASLGDSESLEIIGLYTAEEENRSDFDNLGLARAAAARAKFDPPLDIDRISIKSELATTLPSDQRFLGLRFGKITSQSVQKFDDKVIINFPSASANMIENAEVNTYLDELAAFLKANPNKTIAIVGHTDNTASEEINLKWGMRRANAIARILTAKGISNTQFKTSSKGESEPISSNDTQMGRQQNRRVEINIKD